MLIRPTADGVSISGNPAQGFGVIQLNGADNVTIDGDNPNTGGTNRDLTVANTATATTTYNSVIRVATASTTNTTADNNTDQELHPEWQRDGAELLRHHQHDRFGEHHLRRDRGPERQRATRGSHCHHLASRVPWPPGRRRTPSPSTTARSTSARAASRSSEPPRHFLDLGQHHEQPRRRPGDNNVGADAALHHPFDHRLHEGHHHPGHDRRDHHREHGEEPALLRRHDDERRSS